MTSTDLLAKYKDYIKRIAVTQYKHTNYQPLDILWLRRITCFRIMDNHREFKDSNICASTNSWIPRMKQEQLLKECWK
jgi:DNA-directed RNA polymerase subunit N (RpoN/RPB10)